MSAPSSSGLSTRSAAHAASVASCPSATPVSSSVASIGLSAHATTKNADELKLSTDLNTLLHEALKLIDNYDDEIARFHSDTLDQVVAKGIEFAGKNGDESRCERHKKAIDLTQEAMNEALKTPGNEQNPKLIPLYKGVFLQTLSSAMKGRTLNYVHSILKHMLDKGYIKDAEYNDEISKSNLLSSNNIHLAKVPNYRRAPGQATVVYDVKAFFGGVFHKA